MIGWTPRLIALLCRLVASSSIAGRPVLTTVLVCLLSCVFVGSSHALEPPTDEQVNRYRADGTWDEYVASARALGNHRVSPALSLEFQRRLAQLVPPAESGEPYDTLTNLPPPSGIRQGLRSTGVNNIFAILIEFPDYPAIESKGTVDAGLFGNGVASDAPSESLRNFYRRSSYSKLEIRGNTLGYYRSSNTRASIAHTSEGREALIREALTYFDQQGHDFSQYDNDDDGSIDYFCVFWTGPTEDGPIFWWPSYIGGWSSSFLLDGKDFSRATFSWQDVVNVRGNMTRFTPTAVIHETGHALGLPDLYDYDSSVGPGGGVGGLDVMGGRGDHNALSKMLLGWLEPIVGRNAAPYTLGRAGVSPDAVILWPAYSLQRPFTEFFIVQNRSAAGNDQPGCCSVDGLQTWDGLLIWHVDATLDEWGRFAYDNSYTEHKLIRLMEADGLEEIESSPYSNAADKGDFYVVGSEFGPTTRPNSSAYDGWVTDVSVSSIRRAGTAFTFNAGVRADVRRRAVRH
jgi:M6 family metalloprotease-like protein